MTAAMAFGSSAMAAETENLSETGQQEISASEPELNLFQNMPIRGITDDGQYYVLYEYDKTDSRRRFTNFRYLVERDSCAIIEIRQDFRIRRGEVRADGEAETTFLGMHPGCMTPAELEEEIARLEASADVDMARLDVMRELVMTGMEEEQRRGVVGPFTEMALAIAEADLERRQAPDCRLVPTDTINAQGQPVINFDCR